MYIRVVALAFGILLLCPFPESAFAQSQQPKQNAPNEADVILKDSKKNAPETPKELAECMNQWGPQTQMKVGSELPEHAPLFPRKSLTLWQLCRHTNSADVRICLLMALSCRTRSMLRSQLTDAELT